MKKRALSLLLCLLMIGTLLGTGMPAYASVVIDKELTFIDSTAEETSTDAPEESEETEAVPDGESTEDTEAEAEEPSAVEEATESAGAEPVEKETAETEKPLEEADTEATGATVEDGTATAAEADGAAETEAAPETEEADDGEAAEEEEAPMTDTTLSEATSETDPKSEETDKIEGEAAPDEVVKKVELRAYLWRYDTKIEGTKEMLEQMAPVLISDDGQEIKPVRIPTDRIIFEFENVPAGEYTLTYNVPEYHRFVSGKVEADSLGNHPDTDVIGDYRESGSNVTITAGQENNFAIRYELAVAERVNFRVDTLKNGSRGTTTRAMMEQMKPVLKSDDGQEIRPVRISDKEQKFNFENVPDGVYDLEYSYPQGYRFVPGKVAKFLDGKVDYSDTGTKVTITAGKIVNNFFTQLEEDTNGASLDVAKRVNLAVHTLVDGQRGYATKEMLEQMAPRLRAKDGQEVSPTRILDSGFVFEFTNVPAGEYTLVFNYPAGYRFTSEKTDNDGDMGDFLDTKTTVTVKAGVVVNNFYTRLDKVPESDIAKKVELNVHLEAFTFVDGRNFANKAMLEEMKAVLQSDNGQEVQPTRIADRGFTYEFENVPAGEYTLKFICPAGYRFCPGKVGDMGDYVNTGEKLNIKAGAALAQFYTRLEKLPESGIAKKVELNVHTLADGKSGFATKEMLEQMNPILRTDDGQNIDPIRIADRGFTFEWEDVPAGEYTLVFNYPADYRFSAGKTGKMGDFLDTQATVTVKAGDVVNQFYTRLEKASNPSNPAVDPPEENTGNLTVSQTVSGSGGDQNKEFTFTVTLDKQDLNGQYGDMTFTNGVATFTLKHGQSKTANGLPTGASYTVEESDTSGYTVTKTNAAGTIQAGSTATATFENYLGSSDGDGDNSGGSSGSSVSSGGGSGGSSSSSGSSGGGGGSSSHTPQATHVTLTATNTMDGLIPTGSNFTFVLNDANGQPLQTKNNQDGAVTFDPLTFNQPGTYIYYLTQQAGSDPNVNYDTASYKVTVTVTCPYDYAASISYEKNGQAYNSVPAFANTSKSAMPVPEQISPAVTTARALDNVPKTEDSSNLALWGILAAASLMSLAVLLAGTKTRKVKSQGKEHQS